MRLPILCLTLAAISAAGEPNSADHISSKMPEPAEEPTKITAVTFSGNLGINASDVRKALQATRIKTLVPGLWHLRPDYSKTAVDSDLANLRSYYYGQGFFAADVKLSSVETQDGKAQIEYTVDAGSRYTARQFQFAGESQPISGMEDVCRTLLAERRRAEIQGIVDFAATLHISGPPDAAIVTASTQHGSPVRVGRLEFRGNHKFSDTALRRSFLLDEGALVDAILVRKSLTRLASTGWFEPFTDSSVNIRSAADPTFADITIRVREKKARSWFLSGPVGPMSVAGPLEFSIGSHLPPWGRGVLELSSYTVSANLMLFAKPIGQLIPFLPMRRFLPILSLQRPMLPGQTWTSGINIAPQFGARGVLAGYASSHARFFLGRAFASDRDFTPALPVTVVVDERTAESPMLCEPPKTKLAWAKQITGMAVNLAFSFSPY